MNIKAQIPHNQFTIIPTYNESSTDPKLSSKKAAVIAYACNDCTRVCLPAKHMNYTIKMKRNLFTCLPPSRPTEVVEAEECTHVKAWQMIGNAVL